MTGVEWMLLLIGSIFMVGSFFVTEKLSPTELNKIAELSEGELKKIIERELRNAKDRIEDSIDEQLETSVDKVDRALEKETNEKIMAISDFSDTVLESMNKTHNEIMFLYSMLNDKHTELTGMVSDIQRMAADIRNLQENMTARTQTAQVAATVTPMPSRTFAPTSAPVTQVTMQKTPVETQAVAQQKKVEENTASEPEIVKVQPKKEQEKPAEREDIQREILALHREGLTDVQIAKRIGKGVGEVRLVIGLYRGE